MSFKFIQAARASLVSPISSTDMQMLVRNFKDIYGNTITMADVGSVGYLTLDPRSSTDQEIVSYNNIIDNGDDTVTIILSARGLDASANYAAGGTARAHGSTIDVVISNNPQMYNKLGVKENDESITGYWEVPDPITDLGIVNKRTLIALMTGGAVSYDANIIPGTAGEILAAGDRIYLKMADQRWWKASASDTATFDQVDLGIAQGAATAGNAITGGVLLHGLNAVGTYTAGNAYYLANTAGGVVTTADQTNVVFLGFANTSNKLIFVPKYLDMPNHSQKSALVGSRGTPSTTNKYVTQDNLTAASTDQSQTTRNTGVEVGETDASLRKNKIAQSFIPTRTKIRGVRFYKDADTGIFAGTVTAALQADTAGNPSGSDLATKTFTNSEWRALATGANAAIFSSEYASLTSATYHIVLRTSTSDTSNHPNFGANTAGGYTNGGLKYNNTTDGWVAIATTDLYFETLEGEASQAVVTDSAGKIGRDFFDIAKMPVLAYQQRIALPSTGGSNYRSFACGSNNDGSVLIMDSSTANVLDRLARDAKTGMYLHTHSVARTPTTSPGSSIVVLGNFAYLFYDAGANMGCYRYNLADLTSETLMTFSTPIPVVTASIVAWTDGLLLYVTYTGFNTSVTLSVSGTTFTQVTTTAIEANKLGQQGQTSFFDGTNIYVAYSSGVTQPKTIYKLNSATGATVSTTTFNFHPYSDQDQFLTSNATPIFANIDADRMYFGFMTKTYDDTVDFRYSAMISPITKP